MARRKSTKNRKSTKRAGLVSAGAPFAETRALTASEVTAMDREEYPDDYPYGPRPDVAGYAFPPAPGFSPDRLLGDVTTLLTELSDRVDAVVEFLGVQIVPVEEVMPRGRYVAIQNDETEGETDGE